VEGNGTGITIFGRVGTCCTTGADLVESRGALDTASASVSSRAFSASSRFVGGRAGKLAMSRVGGNLLPSLVPTEDAVEAPDWLIEKVDIFEF
jgi:hypothetical protein